MNYTGITIYDASWQNLPAPQPASQPKSNPSSRASHILFGFLRGAGSGLIIVALATLIITFAPIVKQEIAFRTESQLPPPSPASFGILLDTAAAAMRQQAAEDAKSYGVPTDFSIVIPKISAASPVIPNVNAADENAYLAALKQGVAHAQGSKFPGQSGTIYLFAHSTNSPFNVARYNAVFYLLKNLEVGDSVIIFFAGQEYKYKVSNQLVTDANDTSWINDVDNQERLVLQTCWPPGTTWKRLLVVANPI